MKVTEIMGRVARFDGAVMLLPHTLRERARGLDFAGRASAEELRLRMGYPMTALLPGGEVRLAEEPIAKKDLDGVLDIVTGASVHSAGQQLRSGYITARGGYRVGLCGTAIMKDGEAAGFRALTSASIRISREVKGIAGEVAREISRPRGVESTLIVSPPGMGKTTLLRDLVRILSDGDEGLGIKGRRVALADERGELAAVVDGVPQMDLGRRTDVLDAMPKAAAVMLLLRAMNPEIIALDEITAPEDLAAIESASGCGVSLLATAHAWGLSDLRARPLYRRLVDMGIFRKAVLIDRRDDGWRYPVCELEARVV